MTVNITCSNGWWAMIDLSEDQAQRVIDFANRVQEEGTQLEAERRGLEEERE